MIYYNEMDALLVNPWIYDFKAYDLWMKPMGLLYISSILKKAGLKTALVDCLDRTKDEINLKDKKFGCGKYQYQFIKKPLALKNIPRNYKRFGISKEEFLKTLKELPKPKIILITSTMTYWYCGVFDTISILKEIFPKVPVLLGGIYPSLCPEHAKSSGADFVFSEFSVKLFLETIESVLGKLPKAGKLSKNILDYSPDFEHYDKPSYGVILSSLGCPFRCTYCASNILQPLFYQQKAEKTLNEILFLADKYNLKDFAFYDNALLINSKNNIETILNEIIKRNLKLNFHSPNGLHARYITTELAELLFKSGFKTIKIGLESIDPEFQAQSGGKVCNLDLEKAIYNLKKAGFCSKEIGVYIMIGLPEQKEKDILSSIDFVHKLNVIINLTQFSPIPKTVIGEECFKKYLDEPLLHNNTYWLFNHPEISIEKIHKINNMVKQLNNKVN